MKITTLLAAAVLIVTVSAEAEPITVYKNTVPKGRNHGCYRVGMPCNKVKRAIEVATEILDEPVDTSSSLARRCFENGQPCAKARRAEAALRASLKDADFNNFGDGKKGPKHHFCEDGKPCTKGFKRVIARSLPFVEVESIDDVNADPTFCHKPGQQCDKIKRTVDAISEALSKRAAEPITVYKNTVPKGRNHGCYRVGMPCNKAKRDICFRNGQPCNVANRAIDYLDVAAADAWDYVTEDLPESEYSG